MNMQRETTWTRMRRRLAGALVLLALGLLPVCVLAGQPAAGMDSMTVPQLLAAARAAYVDGKLVAPAGDNAVAYYEQVLEKDPGNRVASDALRDSFPYAAAKVREAIQRGELDEAGRGIELLARAAPGNYTVTLLRQQLARQRGSHGAGRHVLILDASADSWVKITDADGQTVDARMLRAGESRTYRASSALRVTVGNAGVVRVTSDGREVQAAPDPHTQVAHFELFAAR